MKLCLYNVENLFLLNQIPSPLTESYRKPPEKIEWIARTILDIDADITMLIEVGGLASLDLLNHRYLGENYYTVLLPGNSDRGIEMGYLVHKRVNLFHQIISHKNESIDFSYPHEISEAKKNNRDIKVHKFSRDVSELRLIDGQNVKLILLLVHLKSKLDKDGIDFNGNLRRKAELKALVKIYNQRRSEFPNIPVIVAGDFNGNAQLETHEPEFSDLYQLTDLKDVLEVINEPKEQRSTYFHFTKDQIREASQLDYIMLPPELHLKVKKEVSGIYQYRDPHGVLIPHPQDSFSRYALPSDHYPIVASFDF